MPTPPVPVTQECPSCGTIQQLPAIFCWQCGAPLLRISYWVIWFFLTVTAGAYGYYGLYAKSMVWPIPLYLYYVLVFVTLSLIITRRHFWTSFRVVLWSLLLIYAMTFLVLSAARFLHNLSTDAIEVLQHVRESYFGIAAVALAAFINLVLGALALTRRFKFTLAYRIFIMFLAVVAYTGGRLLEEPTTGEPKKLSSLALWLPDTTIAEFLNVMSAYVLRVLVAEMVVYSVVMSFVPANAKFTALARKIVPRRSTGQPQPVLVQATSQVTLAILRAGIYIQYFFITLWRTIANFGWGMYRTLRRLTIDFAIPVGAIASVSFLLAVVSEHTAAYVTGAPDPRLVFIPGIHSPLVMIGLSMLGIFMLHMTFLGAVTKFRLADLWRCNMLLLLWLGPFVLAVFLFISLSLIATGAVLKRWDESFPYHFGPLTIASAIGLVMMVAFALLYRQRGHSQGLGLEVRKRLLLAAPKPQTDDEKRSA